MDFDKLTEKAQQIISLAQETALRFGHQQVDGEHIHYALLTQHDGLIPTLVNYMGENHLLMIKDVEQALDKIPKVYGGGAANMYVTRRFNEIFVAF